jgi:hypothetical protein
VVVLAGGSALTYGVVQKRRAAQEVAGSHIDGKQHVSFKPLAPAEVGALDDPAQKDVRVDAKKNTVNFQDAYSHAQITVSQQALPESFKRDGSAFQKMAASFGAKEQDAFDTALGKMYVATKDHANGETQQFAFLKTDTVLFLMQANKQLKPEAWRDYLATLHVVGNE